MLGLYSALIIGVILRFKGLTNQSYWLDELASIMFSNPENNFSMMYSLTVEDVHPPLYQTILWVWFHIFGFSELAGRILSVIIGSISIFAIYLLGKELFNKQIGMYASVIASMNYFLIYFSQMVRSYSLLCLFSILSYIYLAKVLNNYRKQDFIIYLIFTILLIYIHYFGFFLVATQVFVFIFYFIKEKLRRKLFISLALITAIVIIISLVPLMEHILNLGSKSSFWISKPSIVFFKGYFRSYFNSKPLGLLFLMLLLLGTISFFTKDTLKQNKMSIALLVIWVSIGYLLPYLRSITATPILTTRKNPK